MKNQILYALLLTICSHISFAEDAKISKTKNRPPVVEEIAANALKYSDNNKEEEIIVDGKDVLLSGNENKITFKGYIGKIIITGKNNDIYIESVNQIVITGNGNFVSWEKSVNTNGKPVIKDKGGYNNVEKRSGNAQTKEEN